MTYYYKILFLSFIIPFVFSFHKKINFYKNFRIIFISIPISSIFFIIWDIFFTKYEIWGFNKKFVSISILNLPIEEYLFFFIIPFCCLYTYHVINKYEVSFFKKINWNIILNFINAVLVIVAILNFQKIYTLLCLLSCVAIISILLNIKHSINLNAFHTTFILIFIPFILVNGALTGSFYDQTVVWYNKKMILGYYISTIPIEDLIYSYQLQLLNIIIFDKLKS